jgi:hypothetical protein
VLNFASKAERMGLVGNGLVREKFQLLRQVLGPHSTVFMVTQMVAGLFFLMKHISVVVQLI